MIEASNRENIVSFSSRFIATQAVIENNKYKIEKLIDFCSNCGHVGEGKTSITRESAQLHKAKTQRSFHIGYLHYEYVDKITLAKTTTSNSGYHFEFCSIQKP